MRSGSLDFLNRLKTFFIRTKKGLKKTFGKTHDGMRHLRLSETEALYWQRSKQSEKPLSALNILRKAVVPNLY